MKYTMLLASLTLVSSLAQAEPARLAAIDLGGITAGAIAAPPVDVNVDLDFPTIAIGTALGANVASGVQVPTALSVFGDAGVGAGLFPTIFDLTEVKALAGLGID